MAKQRDFLISKYPEQFTPGREWTTNEQREFCKQMMFETKEILDRHNIVFWLAFGTFLGIYREHRLIPYDGDVDLALYFEDYQRILDIEKEFLDLGYEELGTCGDTLIHLCKQGEHIDFSFFRRRGNRRYSNEFFIDESDFKDCDHIRWEERIWRIPNNPEKWLLCFYGVNWKVPIEGLILNSPIGKDLI